MKLIDDSYYGRRRERNHDAELAKANGYRLWAHQEDDARPAHPNGAGSLAAYELGALTWCPSRE